MTFLASLIERQRILAYYGLAVLALTFVALALQILDPRMLANGVNIWVKPAKFLSSVAIFTLTAAWFFGYVRPERRGSRLMRWTVAMLIATGTFELGWIVWQGAHGLESHFNRDTLFYEIMFSLMGLAAILLVATALPLAWEIARRPAPGLGRDFVAAVAIGLVLTFLLGGGFGVAVAMNNSHSVGMTGGGHVPLFGWNRSGGDLRIAHFLGIHAEQAIPILAVLVGGFAARLRWLILAAGTLFYVAVALALYIQAAAGRPLFPL